MYKIVYEAYGREYETELRTTQRDAMFTANEIFCHKDTCWVELYSSNKLMHRWE